MPRRAEGAIAHVQAYLMAKGDGAPGLDAKLEFLRDQRARSPELGAAIDRFLLEGILNLQACLEEVRAGHAALKDEISQLTAEPWHEAVFLGTVAGATGTRALVSCAGSRRVVSIATGIEIGCLKGGDDVYLGNQLNVILGKSSAPGCGETATFDRYTPDGRLIVKWRDDETIVTASEALAHTKLKPGDQIRWSRIALMAYEKVERPDGSSLFLEETPRETFEDVGGLRAQIEEIKNTIGLQLRHPRVFNKYKMTRSGGILLVGPPGTGKTLLARAIAGWLATLSGTGRARFIFVSAASLLSEWYSVSERNVRELFRAAREAAEAEPSVPVVIFIDEIDSLAPVKHRSHMRVDDRVVDTLAIELDGLISRGNVLVLAATNHRDAIDEKLLRPGRLTDLVLEIPRPGRDAALEILSKHLPEDVPYAQNGHGADLGATRREILAAVISRLYSPNGNGELATLVFRDGKRKPVKAADVLNGAVLRNIARRALERACLREAEKGESGVKLDDLLFAAAEALETSVRSLSPHNCHRHLTGLSPAIDVVDVILAAPRSSRVHRFIHLEAE